MRDPYWYGDHHGAGLWLVVMLVLLVLLAATVIVLLLARRSAAVSGTPQTLHATQPARPYGDNGDPYDSAVRMLAERFALGEIDETEFRAKLAVLGRPAG